MTRPLWPSDPQRLGDYELVGRLGEGGMGTVFLGRAPGGRLVAVKVIRPEHAWDQEFRGRFRSEVNRAREVPGFCTAAVLDADPDHSTPYLVVEYVDGPSLSEVIAEQGPLTGGTLHSVAVGVATALAAIHGAGVIHRDLKPQNVLFSLGTPKVIDFGIARAFEATSRHTRTDQMVGTVAYMAPERFETDTDRAAGPPADVFAWGAVVAYAGTGRTPFRGDSAASTAARILTQPPDLTGLDQPLRDLVARTLAKEPAERPTAHELLDLLLAAESPGALEQRPELRRAAEAVAHSGPMQPFPVRTDAAPRRRRGGRLVAMAAAAVVLLGFAGLYAGHVLAASAASSSPSARTATFVAGPSSATASAAAARATTSGVQGPSVVDSLDRPGQWKATKKSENADGWCLFDNHRMVATTSSSTVYSCPGPTATFAGDQTIAVDTTVVDAEACAVIWLRMVQENGYAVSFCPKEIRIGLYEDGDISGEKKVASTAFQPGQTHRAGVAVQNNTATVTVDGAAVLSLPFSDPQLAAGQVQFGAINDARDGDSSAAFANAEIRSPWVGKAVKFPDVQGPGTVDAAAELYSYDAATHVAVLQPVLYLFGTDYCKLMKIKQSDQRCQEENVTVESHVKITLPVTAQPKLNTWDSPQDVDGNCVGTPATGGKCPTTPTKFAKWLKENPGAVVGLTAVDGQVVRLAVMYHP